MGQSDSTEAFPIDSRPSESSMIASHTVNGGPLIAGRTSLHKNSMTFSELKVRFAGIVMFGSAKPRETNTQVSFRTGGSSASTANACFDIGVLGKKTARRAIPELPANDRNSGTVL